MRIAVILPAAGMGKRFNESATKAGINIGSADPLLGGPKASKIELDLAGKAVFLRAVEIFRQRDDVAQILIAVNPDAVDEFRFRWGDKLGLHGVQVVDVKIVPGGKTERWETVLNALKAVGPGITHVAIHDAARPLSSQALVTRAFEAARDFDAVIPGLAVPATLKRVVVHVQASKPADPLDAILGGAKPAHEIKKVVQTVDRSDLIEVQTPQVFEISLLRKAYDQITSGKLTGKGITDDAGLVESLGETVYVVEGEPTNFKITRAEDLKLAEAYLKANEVKEATKEAKRKLFKDDDDE